MKRLAVLLILQTMIYGSLSGQVNRYGTPVTKSYSMQITGGSEQNWSITKDKFGAVYFGNDDNVVIRFDGTRWTTIPLNLNNPTIARALAADEYGIIYVGGQNELGYIEPDSSGRRTYISLTGRIREAQNITATFKTDLNIPAEQDPSEINIGEIRSLIIKDSTVYFLSASALIMFNTLNDSLSYVNLRQLGYRLFERIFHINGKVILSNNLSGLYELKDKEITLLNGGGFFRQKRCLSLLPFEDNKIVVPTLDAGIFLYDYSSGSVDSSFIDPVMFRKLKEFWIYSAVRLFTGEYVFGTTTDGLYVFDSQGKYTGHWTSENTEMTDNVITALYTDPDKNSELWISATASVTKVYANLPFTSITEKMGLDGSVNNFCVFNNSVFVATDKGLFKSNTDKDGLRFFANYGNITSQLFPLTVASAGGKNFLLTGSTFEGIYQIDKTGKIDLLSVIRDPTRFIYQSKINENRFYIGFTGGNIRILEYFKNSWKELSLIKDMNGMVKSIMELENGDLIVLTTIPDGLYKIPYNSEVSALYTTDKGIPGKGLNHLSDHNGDVILSTTSGLLKLNKGNDLWEPCDYLTGAYTEDINTEGFFADTDGNLWVSTLEERYYDILFSHSNDSIIRIKGGPLAVIPDLNYRYTDMIEAKVWLAKSKSIYVIDKEKLRYKLPQVQTLLTRIVISLHGSDSIVMNETFYNEDFRGRRYPVTSNTGQKAPEFRYNLNSLSFFWTTPYMIMEEETLYSYKLDGYEDTWSRWDKISYKDYTNLPFGKYTFRVKARTATEIESAEAVYSFIVLKPWYITPWMIMLYFIAALLIVFGIITAYTRRLKNENIRLEGIVAERTAVVVKQKEELESSIHYASRIQMALLPSEKILEENIRNYFVLFKPRDIVSGDFYWMTKKGERLYIVAADCTGHGVPGAFMSLLGMSFLDEIIDKENAPRADHILNQLRLHVTESLKQVGGDDEAKDGMDIALLVIDFSTQRVEFSGAYNPCFRVRKLTPDEAGKLQGDSAELPDGSMSNGKYLLETIYASKMPIGISSRMNEDFIFYDWKLEKGISYYLFSDGYIDQFGGGRGRKFMKKNFKRLLLEIQDYPMNRQKELLEKNLKEWMGETPQIDDILVMGIRTE